MRTNVIVSEIVRVEIETTTRLLFLEDSPEELIIRGYDSEGMFCVRRHFLSMLVAALLFVNVDGCFGCQPFGRIPLNFSPCFHHSTHPNWILLASVEGEIIQEGLSYKTFGQHLHMHSKICTVVRS